MMRKTNRCLFLDFFSVWEILKGRMKVNFRFPKLNIMALVRSVPTLGTVLHLLDFRLAHMRNTRTQVYAQQQQTHTKAHAQSGTLSDKGPSRWS